MSLKKQGQPLAVALVEKHSIDMRRTGDELLCRRGHHRLQVRGAGLVARPQQAARHQVDVARVADGLVVVADRRAENARLLIGVFVRPDNDGRDVLVGDLAFFVFVMDSLFSGRQRMAGAQTHPGYACCPIADPT